MSIRSKGKRYSEAQILCILNLLGEHFAGIVG